MKRLTPILVAIVVFCGAFLALRGCDEPTTSGASGVTIPDTTVERFRMLLTGLPSESAAVLKHLEDDWHPGYATSLLECIRLLTPDEPRSHDIAAALRRQTGQSWGASFGDQHRWAEWIWRQEHMPHGDYAEVKATIYSTRDRRFAKYFYRQLPTTIRLDEVQWGGVVQDGIPPLANPAVLSIADAGYLADNDVVFGVALNGEARAYPKRILAHHEMVKDRVGGVSINGVYCTLCGSMIVYDTKIDGDHYELGTSGFLYRSNKLMYDRTTQSLWSTLTGEPVIGQLVGKGLKLKPLWVVTTTWREWKTKHPETTVLSLNTGHRRDYSEGAAYADYFASDKLMFPVAHKDDRLRNKEPVLAMRSGDPEKRLAITARSLRKQPVFHGELGRQRFVILTDPSGANRVFEAGQHHFVRWDGKAKVSDDKQREWTVSARELVSPNGEQLARLPAHRAFWFGWYAAFPDTQLIDAK